MATKVKKQAKVQKDFITCRVQFTTEGVKLGFDPPWANESGKHHYSADDYEKKVAKRRPTKPGQAGGKKPKIANGKFNRKEHRHVVSKDRPSRLAFFVDAGTSWRFVKKGIDGKTAGDRSRFSAQTISPSGKVVEATFTPEGKIKDYGYELWLQADVVGGNQVDPDDRPSVTIIIDPVMSGGSIPPGP